MVLPDPLDPGSTPSAVDAVPQPAPPGRSAIDIHPKVSISIFAGSAVTVLLGVLKTRGIDLSGYEPDLIVLVMGAVGYFVQGS